MYMPNAQYCTTSIPAAKKLPDITNFLSLGSVSPTYTPGVSPLSSSLVYSINQSCLITFLRNFDLNAETFQIDQWFLYNFKSQNSVSFEVTIATDHFITVKV